MPPAASLVVYLLGVERLRTCFLFALACCTSLGCSKEDAQRASTGRDATAAAIDAKPPELSRDDLVDALFRSYLGVSRCDERYQYITPTVAITGAVIPPKAFADFYEGVDCSSFKNIKVISLRFPDDSLGVAWISFTDAGGKENKVRYYVRVNDSGSWAVDWGLTQGWSEPSLAALKIRKKEFTATSGGAWVIGDVQLDDYFNYGYDGMSRDAYSVSLMSGGTRIWVYFAKDTPGIYEVLKDAKPHWAAVKVMYNSRLLRKDDKGEHAEAEHLVFVEAD